MPPGGNSKPWRRPSARAMSMAAANEIFGSMKLPNGAGLMVSYGPGVVLEIWLITG
ncbi:hypothetical protein D3C72_1939330 [compost metagenome]